MAGVNKVIILGNVGKDPETRFLPNGGAVTNLTIATSETWKDKQTGEAKEKTEWHRVVIFGKLAEIAGEYVKKGSKLYIEGALQTRKWTNQQGQDQYTTEIVLQGFGGVMQMLDGKPAGQQQASPQQQGGFQGQNQGQAQQQRQQGQSNSQGFKNDGQQFGQQQNTARQQTNQAVQQNVNQGQQNVNMNGAVDFDDDLAF